MNSVTTRLAILIMLSSSINLTSLAGESAPLSSAVEMINGRPMVVINGEPHYPMIHSLTDVPSGRWSWEELPQHNIRNFCQSGVRLFQLDLSMEHMWTADDKLDITLARKQIAGVLEVCPDAGVIFRLHVRAPTWWLHQHPEEWVVYADSDYYEEQKYGLLRVIEHDNNPVRRISMASRKWRRAATEKFEQFLTELAQTPEGNALVGIQVANGVYGEWHNWGFYSNEPDVSQPMTLAFREWTKNKYITEEALRKAWNNETITFDTVEAADMEDRATEGIFRDLNTERHVIDYFECMHQTVADNIIHFTDTLKANWPRPIIAGTFYGYYFSTFGRQAAGGHLQLQRILNAESIDYLSGPQAYGPESIKLGDPYRSRSLITSVRLHNKLWLDEMDVEPRIPLIKSSNYDLRVQESVADVRRNTAFTYTKGMGLWFYDFNISGVDLDGYTHQTSGSQGNWDHPVVMRQIEQMKALFEERSIGQPYKSAADVLFVYDTDSFYYTASLEGKDPVSNALIDHNTLAAFRSGVIFDPIHLDDLQHVDLSQYKVVVFGNTYLLNDEERRFIKDKVANNGRQIVWFYAPGYIDETKGISGLENVESLTGFKLKQSSILGSQEITLVSSPDDSFTLGEEVVDPVFCVTDPQAEIFGKFSGNGDGAIASKKFGDHTAWFVSLPSKSREPINFLMQKTGAHVYGESDAFFYGGGGILVMHTKEGGPRDVQLKNGKNVHLKLPNGPFTVIIDNTSGEVLLNQYSQDHYDLKVQY